MNAVVLTETGAPDVLRIGTAPDPVAGAGRGGRRPARRRPQPPGRLPAQGCRAQPPARDPRLRRRRRGARDRRGRVRHDRGRRGRDPPLPRLGRRRGRAGAGLPHPRGARRRHLCRADPDPGGERLPQAGKAVVRGGRGAAAGRAHGLPRAGQPGGHPLRRDRPDPRHRRRRRHDRPPHRAGGGLPGDRHLVVRREAGARAGPRRGRRASTTPRATGSPPSRRCPGAAWTW